jgi:hypothetical protein
MPASGGGSVNEYTTQRRKGKKPEGIFSLRHFFFAAPPDIPFLLPAFSAFFRRIIPAFRGRAGCFPGQRHALSSTALDTFRPPRFCLPAAFVALLPGPFIRPP